MTIYKIITFFLISAFGVFAHAQDNLEKFKATRTVYCFDINVIWEAAKGLEHEIVWVGKDDSNLLYALMISKKDKSFNILHFSENRGCLIGSGIDSRYGNAFEQPKK